MKNRKWWKKPGFFGIIILAVLVLPVITNVILIISPSVTYHLLMRYQWVLYLIGLVAFVGNGTEGGKNRVPFLQWLRFAARGSLFSFTEWCII